MPPKKAKRGKSAAGKPAEKAKAAVKSANKAVRYAGIAGILSVIVSIPLIILEVLKAIKMMGSKNLMAAYVLVYLISLALYIIFVWGFKIVGEKTGNSLLKNTSYLLIAASIAFYAYSMLMIYNPFPPMKNAVISIIILITYGIMEILFGIGVLRLKNKLGGIAAAAGVMSIIAGIGFATVILAILSVLLIFPIYILEIILLFKASKKL